MGCKDIGIRKSEFVAKLNSFVSLNLFFSNILHYCVLLTKILFCNFVFNKKNKENILVCITFFMIASNSGLESLLLNFFSSLPEHTNASQWTRVNLNYSRTNPCAGLCDVRQVPARPYPLQAWFQLWWRGHFHRPILPTPLA